MQIIAYLFWLAVIILIALLVSKHIKSNRGFLDSSDRTELDELREKLAKGEISQEEFDRRTRDRDSPT